MGEAVGIAAGDGRGAICRYSLAGRLGQRGAGAAASNRNSDLPCGLDTGLIPDIEIDGIGASVRTCRVRQAAQYGIQVGIVRAERDLVGARAGDRVPRCILRTQQTAAVADTEEEIARISLRECVGIAAADRSGTVRCDAFAGGLGQCRPSVAAGNVDRDVADGIGCTGKRERRAG